jgi:hypothetical protein
MSPRWSERSETALEEAALLGVDNAIERGAVRSASRSGRGGRAGRRVRRRGGSCPGVALDDAPQRSVPGTSP